MGTMGLALPWETRISSVPREREMRVEPSEDLPGRPSETAGACCCDCGAFRGRRTGGALPDRRSGRIRAPLCVAWRAHEERRAQFAGQPG